MSRRCTWSQMGKVAVIGCGLLVLAGALGQGCPSNNTPAPDPNSGLTGKYVGSERCLTCHNQIHTTWLDTRHAKAYDELVALNQQTNVVCLQCHTTGYGQDGGFQSVDTTELLANVGCEACHGASRDHVMNVAEASLRPPVSMSANWCAQCHNGFHNNTYSEWTTSFHGRSTEGQETAEVAEELSEGTVANNCGTCHASEVQLAKGFNLVLPTIPGGGADTRVTTILDNLLLGEPVDEIHAATCATCHDPHMNTGNAFNAPTGHDRQLRWPQVASPEPANTIAATQDVTRFNLCGHCHHNRSAGWTSNSRPPHPSLQSNMYIGEMPTDTGQTPLVANERSVHRFVPGQCTQCHMQTEAFNGPASVLFGETTQPVSVMHTFRPDALPGCVASGCHPNEATVAADKQRLQAEVQARMDAILARLGPVTTWGYSSAGSLPLGGPSGATTTQTNTLQAAIPVQVRKVRYLWSYVNADGSLGVHNPGYTRSILSQAETLLTQAGK